MDGKTHQYNLFRWARYRAGKQGIDFQLNKEDINIPMYCPILNVQLTTGDKVSTTSSATIDRKDNNRGYTKDNVWVISNLANMMKSKATPKELVLFSNWVAENFPHK